MRRKKMKAQKRIIVVGALSLLLCFSIAYAAFNTTISLRAKGNIKKVTSASKLRKLADAKSSDGLFADPYENGRYFFKGADPNNYIIFNNEEWRIVSVEYDDTIKIVKNSPLEDTLSFDSVNSTDWNQVSINKFLNETYAPSLLDLDSVVEHNFAIGAVTLNSDYSNMTLNDQITSENGNYWNGKVGLITASEYLRANNNTDECGSLYLNNTNYEKCRTTNYLNQILATDYTVFWTMSPIINNTISNVVEDDSIINDDAESVIDENSDSTESNTQNSLEEKGLVLDNKYNYVFGVSVPFKNTDFKEQEIPIGSVNPTNVSASYSVVPVLYLNADVVLEGNGTKDDPFIIEK